MSSNSIKLLDETEVLILTQRIQVIATNFKLSKSLALYNNVTIKWWSNALKIHTNSARVSTMQISTAQVMIKAPI